MLRGTWAVGVMLVGVKLGLAATACAQTKEKPQEGPTPEKAAATPPAAPAQDTAQTAQASTQPKKLNPFTGDTAAIAEGKKLWFKYNCYGCHGTQGGGGIGTNLIDSQWLYGGDDQSVFNTIKNGQGQMPALAQIANIPDQEIWKLIAYVRSLYKGEPDKVIW